MLDQQPDETRFYYWMTPEGRLATPEAQILGSAPFVDATQPQQAYYCSGIVMLFLTRMYMATGEERWLAGAQKLFDFSLRCADDAYAYPPSGKGSVAAAILHTITGDSRAKAAACQFGDYLLQEQSPEGWWRNPQADNMIIRLDHTAEFIDPYAAHTDLTELVEIPEGTAFVLHPGEFVLGSTIERIGLPDDIVARVDGKSSLGRLGILIHATAGFIDAGFNGQITLELSNVATLPIRLWPGMKIGQISFMKLDEPVERPYGHPELGSKYQGQSGPVASEYRHNRRGAAE